MSFKVGDMVTVTKEHAPFYGQSGPVGSIDSLFLAVPLVGVRLAEHAYLRWYGENDLSPAAVNTPTEQIPEVTNDVVL